MDAQKFGAFVQARRKELGMNQTQLADKLHVTAKAVSRWERGVGFPDIKLLEPLADALEITIVELMHSKLIEEDIPKETAAVMVTETVNAIREQEKLARRTLLFMPVGYLALIAACFFLEYISFAYDFEPEWIGRVIRLIATMGCILVTQALHYITRNTYQQLSDRSKRLAARYVVAGMALLGLILIIVTIVFFPVESEWFPALMYCGILLLLLGIACWFYFIHKKSGEE